MLRNQRVEQRYNQVRPTRSVSGQVLNGSIDFDFISNPDAYISLQESYLNGRFTITKSADWNFAGGVVDSNGTITSTMASHDGVCQNPFAVMINSATLYINDKEVSSNDTFSAASTHMKLAFNNADEELNSLSPVVPYDFNYSGDYDDPLTYEAGILSNPKPRTLVQAARAEVLGPPAYVGEIKKTGTYHFAVSDMVDSRIQRIFKCCPSLQTQEQNGNYDGNDKIQFHFAMPLSPLFVQESFNHPLYQCKIRLSLAINGEHPRMIGLNETAATFGVVCNDLYFNILTYKNPSGPPRSLKFTSNFTETSTTSRVYTGSSIQLNTDSSAISYALISFGKSFVGSTNDINQHSGAFQGTYAEPNLRSLYVTHGGRSFPSPSYNFVGHSDCSRAYFDYRVFTQANSTNTASVLTFRQWMESPLFVFSVLSEPGSQNNILTVSSSAQGDLLEGYNMYVTTLFSKELMIEYNESGLIVDTVVSSIV